MKEKHKAIQWIDLSVIFVLVLCSVLLDSEAFGLRTDCVNPEYLAVQLLNPNSVNSNYTLPHIGVPFLGNLYYGTLTMFVQCAAIFVTGSANLILLRIENVLYAFAACAGVYCVLREIGIKRIFVNAVELCLITSISFFTFTKSQYYIQLPGMALILFSILLILKGRIREKKQGYVLIAGILAGLAFYSYFIYLFFVPAYIVWLLSDSKYKKEKGYSLFCFCGGFIIGIVGYLLGYLEIVLKIISEEAIKFSVENVLYIYCVIIAVLSCIFLVKTWKKTWQNKGRGMIFNYIFSGGLAFIVSFTFCLIVNNYKIIFKYFFELLDSMDVTGTPASIRERVIFIWDYLKSIYGNYIENSIYGKEINQFGIIYFIASIIGCLSTIFLCLENKKIAEIWGTRVRNVHVFSGCFFFGSCLFVSRMGDHHFVPMYFAGFIIIAIAVQILYEEIAYSDIGIRRICKGFLWGILAVSLGINCINLYSTHNFLINNGCQNSYSNQINQLAYEANNNRNDNVKELYVFPEGGIVGGFTYLTNNAVCYSLNIENSNEINAYYNSGYTVKVCFFDSENEEKYRENLLESGITNILKSEYKDNAGYNQMYVLEVPGIQKSEKELCLGTGFYSDNWMSEEGHIFVNESKKELVLEYYVTAEMVGSELVILDQAGNELVSEVLSEGVKVTVVDLVPDSQIYILKVSDYMNPYQDTGGEDKRNLSILVNNAYLQ